METAGPICYLTTARTPTFRVTSLLHLQKVMDARRYQRCHSVHKTDLLYRAFLVLTSLTSQYWSRQEDDDAHRSTPFPFVSSFLPFSSPDTRGAAFRRVDHPPRLSCQWPARCKLPAILTAFLVTSMCRERSSKPASPPSVG